MTRGGGPGATCPAALLVLLACSTARGETPSDYRYLRFMDVQAPGWVRLALDGPAQASGHPGSDWRILDPEGKQVRLAVLRPRTGWLEVRTLSVNQAPAGVGYLIVFDLGPTPSLHDRLRIQLKQELAARGCQLQGSRDRESWSDVARGDLFRLGEDDSLQHSDLQYELADWRYLRLTWPREAGFPRFQKVLVHVSGAYPGGPVPLQLPFGEVRVPGTPRAYCIEYPAGALPVLRLDLEVGTKDDLAYSVSRLESHRWVPFHRGVGSNPQLSDTLALRIPRQGEPLRTSRLLLRLFPRAEILPELAAAKALLPPAWLLFHAPRAGRYRLLYGARRLAGDASLRLAPETATNPALDVEAGQTQELPPPPLPEEVRTSPTRSRRPRSRGSYRVIGDGIEPGTVVRLELPEPVLEALSETRSSLRLRADGRDVPHIEWTREEPAPALVLTGQKPVPLGDEEGTRRIVVDLPAAWRSVHEVELSTPRGSLEREVEVVLERTPRPGVELDRAPLALLRLDCGETAGTADVPCRAAEVVYPPGGRWERLALVFRDGDRQPLKEVSLTLWRTRKGLAFLWPPADEVELLVVSGRTLPAHYWTFRRYSDRILQVPWREVRLDLEAAAADEGAAERARRTWLSIVLAAVALVLLWILARSIRGGVAA